MMTAIEGYSLALTGKHDAHVFELSGLARAAGECPNGSRLGGCGRSAGRTGLQSNSLFIREITGNFLRLAVIVDQKAQITPQIQPVLGKSPPKLSGNFFARTGN